MSVLERNLLESEGRDEVVAAVVREQTATHDGWRVIADRLVDRLTPRELRTLAAEALAVRAQRMHRQSFRAPIVGDDSADLVESLVERVLDPLTRMVGGTPFDQLDRSGRVTWLKSKTAWGSSVRDNVRDCKALVAKANQLCRAEGVGTVAELSLANRFELRGLAERALIE